MRDHEAVGDVVGGAPGREQVDDLPLAGGQRALDRPQPVEALGAACGSARSGRARRGARPPPRRRPRRPAPAAALRGRPPSTGSRRRRPAARAARSARPPRRASTTIRCAGRCRRIARVASTPSRPRMATSGACSSTSSTASACIARLGDDGDPGVLRARWRSDGGRAGRRRRRRCRSGMAPPSPPPIGGSLDRVWGYSADASNSTRATCSGSSQVGTWPQPVSVTWRALGSRRLARGALARVQEHAVLVAPGDGDRAARLRAGPAEVLDRLERGLEAGAVGEVAQRARGFVGRDPPRAGGEVRERERAARRALADQLRVRRGQLRDATGLHQEGAGVDALAVVDEAGGGDQRRPSAPCRCGPSRARRRRPASCPRRARRPSRCRRGTRPTALGQRLDRRPSAVLLGVAEAGQVEGDDLALAR